ncbi:hypothetical protein SCA6_013311 [Theobroma cacao]
MKEKKKKEENDGGKVEIDLEKDSEREAGTGKNHYHLHPLFSPSKRLGGMRTRRFCICPFPFLASSSESF